MRYGYFDNEQREYVITRPDTPRSWSNYLGSTEYGAIITNNAGGYSFYRSTARGRLTRLHFNSIPMDQPGRYIYLRDDDDGAMWSGSWQPCGCDLSEFESECRHGTGYTTITSRHRGIECRTAYVVPLGAAFECWIVRLSNTSDRPRSVSAFTFTEFTNDWHVGQDTGNLQYTQYIVDCSFEEGVIERTSNGHLAESSFKPLDLGGSRSVFLATPDAHVSGFDTDRDVFLGPYRTYANPIAVERGTCSGSTAHGDNACGSLHTRVRLDPGESHEFVVLMGVGTRDVAARDAIRRVPDAAAAWRELDTVRAYWHDRLNALLARTADDDLDSMVNVWNAYNALITFAWSRAASLVYSGERDGLGYRDTVQDILGVLHAIPDEARERLDLMISGQVSSGGAMPVVRPFEHRPGHERPPTEAEYRSDDCLWLFHTVPAYVKETGDVDYFNRRVPFADAGEATVFEHLRRAIEFTLSRLGAHGLPCGLAADWNDCLVLGQRGESTFVGFQLRHALLVYADIARLLERPEEVSFASTGITRIDDAIAEHTWDGGWFIRGFREDGRVLGSMKNAEGAIYLNPQAWAVMSGAALGDRARAAMDAVHDRLATEHGIALCDPPYRETPIDVVRSGLYNPSMKENGGIFCHPQSWAVIAETMLGRGDRAYGYLRAFLPAAYNDRADVREIEPYVFAQSAHGRHSRRFGASRLPWLSGTVAWTYFATTQHVLGIRPDYAGLRIDPCVPQGWGSFRVSRRFRGADYSISVDNPDAVACGVRELRLNGREIDPTEPIPVSDARDTNTVTCRLGEGGVRSGVIGESEVLAWPEA